MTNLYDEDGIDGPFERAMAKMPPPKKSTPQTEEQMIEVLQQSIRAAKLGTARKAIAKAVEVLNTPDPNSEPHRTRLAVGLMAEALSLMLEVSDG